MKKPRYPLIRTVYGREWEEKFPGLDRLHNVIEVTYAEGQEPQYFCGDSWCSGACKIPAAIIPAVSRDERHEMKMYSSMTACGPLMQWWRVDWQGEKVVVPSEHHEDFSKRMWW